MSLDPDLLAMLRCPENHGVLELASDDQVAAINAQITSGAAALVGGGAVDKPIEAGLVRADGAVLYPIVDGIPVLLIEQAIALSP